MDSALGIAFERIDADKKMIYFKDDTGAEVSKELLTARRAGARHQVSTGPRGHGDALAAEDRRPRRRLR